VICTQLDVDVEGDVEGVQFSPDPGERERLVSLAEGSEQGSEAVVAPRERTGTTVHQSS
jgi:hypothetical protein